MTVNRVARATLLVVGWLAVFAFFAPMHEARFTPARSERHTRIGMPDSPWLTVDWVEVRDGLDASSSLRADFTLRSWSWAALAVGGAVLWVRRRFTSEVEAVQREGALVAKGGAGPVGTDFRADVS